MTSVPRTLRRLVTRGAVAVALAACRRTPEPARDTQVTPSSASSGPAAPATPAVVARGVRLTKAPAGPDAAAIIRAETEAARALGRDLVVYVGAPWCEPCRRIHAAALGGALDEDFPTLTLLEFDLDVDRDRLAAAGYGSNLVPLFVRPGPDGRPTPRRFEGSVKGDRAVAYITPRLQGLLEP